MKFQKDKQEAIRRYILEKIAQGEEGLTKAVSETFAVNQNTVYGYVSALVEEGCIRRVKRGVYELVGKQYSYHLQRSKGEVENETAVYRRYLLPLVEDFTVNVRDIWEYVFSEMFNNVIDHSGAENVDIQIEQNELETRVCLTDDGVGIFEKIKGYFGFEDLDEAISELFKGKLTTDSKNHSGEGIFFSSKIMDLFLITSGGKVFSCNKYDMSSLQSVPTGVNGGTTVLMTLSNSSHKRTKEVFDQYADVDYGFNKTIVPIKNMFDASPVSRSQAKRVSFRLDKFTEAEIDFSEVEWMGQGFAHQLFVVFQNEHPEVRLTPTHMNQDVEKMYRHVMG